VSAVLPACVTANGHRGRSVACFAPKRLTGNRQLFFLYPSFFYLSEDSSA